MRMKKILYTGMLLVAAMLLLPMSVFGQLAPSGTWNTTTISDTQTVNLAGNVTITGMITISSGGSLTITNSTGGPVTISRSSDIVMFRVNNGGLLTIRGEEGKEIVVDGGANFSWNETLWEDRKGKSWEDCGHGTVKYTPLTTTTPAWTNSMIESNGDLNFEYTRLQQFNGGREEKSALRIALTNTKCGITNLKNCEITLCSSEEGSAIYVGGQNGGNAGNDNESCAVTLGNVTISRCMVNPNHNDEQNGNEAAWGGVIRFKGASVSDLKMTDCTMKQNYSTGDGSCLWWNAAGSATVPSTLILNGCTFEDNRADRDAGAVRLESGFKFEGKTTVFKNNSCGRYGGAIQVADYNAGTVQTANFDYNLTELLDVNSNRAHVGGGGIAFFYVTTALKQNTTFNIHLDGPNVSNNWAGERGGGILFTDLRPESNVVYKFNIYLNKGTISDNTAVRAGGGIFARKMTIQTNTSGDKVTISRNIITDAAGVAGEDGAKGGGGGINLYDGEMTLNTCEITGNTVTGADGHTGLDNGYGGGIMLNRSDFTLSGTNNISGNEANVGGGVAALNETEDSHTVSLNSGEINGNKANLCGGGVAIVGNVKMTVDGVNITGNTALNGGGIYMRGRTAENTQIAGANATMTYTGGQITGNKANKGENTPILNGTTANGKTTDNITGMGGGICVGANSTLELLIKERVNLGIQNNEADNGADDVFCNGTEGILVVLPNVSQMELENGNRLFWVEDYITNDTDYKQGTNVNKNWNSDNIRFRDALKSNRTDQVFRLSESSDYTFTEQYKSSNAIYQKFENKYMCLTLGTVMSYIVLQKGGMAERDNAIFKIYRWEIEKGEAIPSDVETNKDYYYATMILTNGDKAGDFRRKTIQAEYGYFYYIKETKWSWAYETSASNPANGVRRIDRNTISDADRTFTFTNTPKDTPPPHAEDVKVNEIKGN